MLACCFCGRRYFAGYLKPPEIYFNFPSIGLLAAPFMLKFSPIAVFLALFCTASYADNCDDLRGQIESKIKAAGVTNFTVTVVDVSASAPGKVVGSCSKGANKIIYLQMPAQSSIAASAASPASKTTVPAKKSGDGILTECKDGTVSVGGSCK
jgi:hypothetical protein